MRRQSTLYFILAAFAGIYAYLSWSLGRPFVSPFWIWLALAVPFAGVILYPLLYFANRRKPKTSHNPTALQWLAYMGMAGLSFLFPMVFLRDFLHWALSLAQSPSADALLNENVTYVIFAVSVLLLIFGVWQALGGPRTKKVRVTLDSLLPATAAALKGLTIVQISDLHVGPTIHRHYVENVVRKINALNPDLIVLTGDIADGNLAVYKDDVAPLKDLRAKHGVFFVMGNHEFYWDGPSWLAHMQSLGIKTLANQNQLITINGQTVAMAGVLDPAAAMVSATEGPNVALAMKGTENANFKVLLAHQPGIAEQCAEKGVDLQLSGHTHGGQFFPWNLVVRKVHKYHQGLFTLGRMKIYVSPGTGSWGPPVRLGTRTEITQLVMG